MGYNYDFYYASVLVLAILLIYRGSIPRINTLNNRLFSIFLWICMACCVSDIVSGGILMEHYPERVEWNYLGQMLSYAFQHAVPVAYFLYMYAMVKDLEHYPKRTILYVLPAIVEQILIWTTPYTHLAFQYTAEEGYQRGVAMPFFILIALWYLALSIILVLKWGKELGKRYVLITFVFLVTSCICIVIQMWDSTYVLLGAASAIGCLIMQLTLQNPLMIKEAKEKEVEARIHAEEASEAKSTFLANMSHEIRTPMNAICGMAEMLDRTCSNPLEREYVQTIQEASNRLLRIIDDVLDFSKIDAGKTELIEAEYSFPKLLTDVEEIIEARLQEKEISFEVYVGNPIPEVLVGDEGKVHQILINILGNAVKFTNEGKIMVTVGFVMQKENRIQLHFWVADTGIGIRDEDMGKLFNQFSQVDAARNREVEGTGLGLVLSKRLANLMNGDVTVESEYGVGSTFRITLEQQLRKNFEFDTREFEKIQVYVCIEDGDTERYLCQILARLGISPFVINDFSVFQTDRWKDDRADVVMLFYSYDFYYPVVQCLNVPVRAVAMLEYYTVVGDDEQPELFLRKPFDIFKLIRLLRQTVPALAEEDKKNEIVVRGARIAVVDDNKVNLRVVAMLLKELGVMPETFISGKNLIKALENGREYDIIFLDHMMPEMDGVETTERIRRMHSKYAQKAIIIALTANAVHGVEKEYKRAGMNDWLFKPVNLERLQEKLKQYLPPEMLA